MEWGSAAVDVSRHILLVNTIQVPNYNRLLTRAEADALGLKRMTAETAQFGGFNEGIHPPQEGTPYGGLVGPFMSPLKIPCSQPPYGVLSAVDLSSGKLIWSRKFGTARDIGPWRIPSFLPFTIGVPNIGGGVATQSGLFFIGATQDAYLRAYDTATGELLWKSRLPAGGNATPVTYVSPVSRRQFVVIAAGGSAAVGAPDSDYIVAYALPEQGK
jgi:quinoprotein glucose dehydrogenase